MTKSEYSFYVGVLIGLQHIYNLDCSVTFRALMIDVGAKNVVKVAKSEGALEWSGLLHYRWCDKSGRFTPKRAC